MSNSKQILLFWRHLLNDFWKCKSGLLVEQKAAKKWHEVTWMVLWGWHLMANWWGVVLAATLWVVIVWREREIEREREREWALYASISWDEHHVQIHIFFFQITNITPWQTKWFKILKALAGEYSPCLCCVRVCSFCDTTVKRSGEKDEVATSNRACGWQQHHTLITVYIYSLSIFPPLCVCVYAHGHFAIISCHFQGSVQALSSNPQHKHHERSASSQWKSASSMEAVIVPEIYGAHNQCKPRQHHKHINAFSDGMHRSTWNRKLSSHLKPRRLHFIQRFGLHAMRFEFTWLASNEKLWTYIQTFKFVHMLRKSVPHFHRLPSSLINQYFGNLRGKPEPSAAGFGFTHS